MREQVKLHCIPRLENMEQWETIAEQYDAVFEYNDFFMPQLLDTPEQLEKVIATYENLPRDRRADTLHGVFFDIVIGSEDRRIAEVCEYRLRQSMSIAERLGCKAVIFHTNFIANFHSKYYQDKWVERNRAFWREVLANYPSLSVYMFSM